MNQKRTGAYEIPITVSANSLLGDNGVNKVTVSADPLIGKVTVTV
jgi:hypothetical protein